MTRNTRAYTYDIYHHISIYLAIYLELIQVFDLHTIEAQLEDDHRLPLFLRAPRSRADAEGGPRGTMADRVGLPDWGYDPGFWGLPPTVANVTGEAPRQSHVTSSTLVLTSIHNIIIIIVVVVVVVVVMITNRYRNAAVLASHDIRSWKATTKSVSTVPTAHFARTWDESF